ncbi:LCP family protein, partial [Candidatus Collierbacteria bacterium]|nr:LCP family protein [Candidatus Collierbacteria bacterium]
LSIPRDLWVDSLKTKINAVYHYGNLKGQDEGIKLTELAILETLGIPIHYTLVVNFDLFTKAIDLAGGVEVDVANAFTDYKFPIPGRENAEPPESRYETISFTAGRQLMDGKKVLKFVRSRNASGDEGTDFARSRRQHQVISALRQKILSTDFLLDKDNLEKLYQITEKNLITNITPDLYPVLARLVLESRRYPVIDIPISTETEGDNIAILEHPPTKNYQGQWVLIAKDNNWKALHRYLENKLSGVQ